MNLRLTCFICEQVLSLLAVISILISFDLFFSRPISCKTCLSAFSFGLSLITIANGYLFDYISLFLQLSNR